MLNRPRPNFAYATQFELMYNNLTLVVEGPDCTGKTTLAKYLARELKAAYFHSSARGSLKLAQYDYLRNVLDNVNNCKLLSDLPVVLDRHWPSEECYAPVLRPSGRFVYNGNTVQVANPVPTGEFFAQLEKLNAVYIFCLASDPEEAIKRHEAQQDPDHPYSVQQYVKVYYNYIALARKLLQDGVKLTYYSIEQDGHQLDKFLQKILTIHEEKKIQAGLVR